MHAVITITLAGHERTFRLHDDAHATLRRYLDRAASSLTDDPGRSEVLDDLEQAIGDRLLDRLGADDRIVVAAEVEAVLDVIGPVEADGRAAPGLTADRPRGRRRLYRIREGQEVAGVCTGLAAYAELDVGWVRTIFVLLILVTVGLFLLVYIAMAFILPVVGTHEAWLAALDAPES
jgi:phage shock protein PspC (stress-responsive transcriptional regulator)